jgi:hypothetical protein
MLRQLYFHTLLIIFAVLFPSLVVAKNGVTCGSNSLGCAWSATAWEGMNSLRREICDQQLTAGSATPGQPSVFSRQNSWAQVQVILSAGYTNSHCWNVTQSLIANCLNTANRKNSQSGNSCADADCTEWYSITMYPVSENCP